nr:division plane positioning ATPase MipZ [Rubellimicrobium aerolatum]
MPDARGEAVAHIIVVGNEKGGAGKSTVAMHVASALARMGHRVGCIDLDVRQRSLGRYIENRTRFLAKEGLDLPTPRDLLLPEIDEAEVPEGKNAQDLRLGRAVAALEAESEFIVIDCPGSHTRLAQVAHSMADTLVTPLNDSFVDFDLLARIDTDGEKILGPSVYAEMVWSARQLRAQAGLAPIDWIVLRNRLGSQAMLNKQRMEAALARLAKRIGFRVGPGFSERVVFRELFPRGLTLLDLKDIGVSSLSMSNVAARQELRELVRALGLPGVAVRF